MGLVGEENKAEAVGKRAAIREVAALMLRMGFTAFGGPAAHIAMLEKEVVQRRRWLTSEAFLDLLGATNLIPGPSSTQMMIHVGMRRAGVAGLWLAGLGFILPAVLITLAFAVLYTTYGSLPQAQGALSGIKPAVLAVVAAAVWRLGRTAVKNGALALLGAVVVALYLWRGHELSLLLGSGIVGVLISRPRPAPPARMSALLWLAPAAVGASPASPWAVGLFFLKMGCVLFGGGYVLLAFVQEGLVRQHHWLTQQQLLDAIAVGQFTPGPVFSTATFIGFLIAGFPGAAAATIGIFLPSFFLVWATHPLVPRLRRSSWAAGFLDGVNAGAVALMAGVCIQLALGSLSGWHAWLIAGLALAMVLGTQTNSAWVILTGALLGSALRWFG